MGEQVSGMEGPGSPPKEASPPVCISAAVDVNLGFGYKGTLPWPHLRYVILFVVLFKDALINMKVRRLPTTPQTPTLV